MVTQRSWSAQPAWACWTAGGAVGNRTKADVTGWRIPQRLSCQQQQSLAPTCFPCARHGAGSVTRAVLLHVAVAGGTEEGCEKLKTIPGGDVALSPVNTVREEGDGER